MLRPVVLSLTAALLSGCASIPYYRCHSCWRSRPDVCTLTPVADEERQALAVANDTPLYIAEIPHQPPRVTAPEPAHVPFDSAAALAAIHDVNLSPCSARGAARSYGHARITFDPTGRASAVLIDSPAGMTSDAVTCIGNALGQASAPPFDGAPITVGASYFVL